LLGFLDFLSFGFKNTVSPFPKRRCLRIKKAAAGTKLSEEEKLLEEKTAGFVESIAKTNTEKITKEILEGLSEDTDDSDSYDAESGGEDSEDRPWRPSHAVFGK
jgi:flagellar motility protein MotE (MotC chaperone)